jgi:hypothetical protein
VVFGTPIPLGLEDPKPYAVENLGRALYTVVPAIILLGGFFPLGDWLAAGGRTERFKGLFLGSALAMAHGLFLSQLAILPLLAASYRLLGNPFAPAVLLADFNAALLGLQLLLWTAALGLLLKSNRGLAIVLAYALHEAGRLLAWGGEFLGDLEVSKGLVKLMAFLGRILPSGQLRSDAPAWKALPFSLGGPLLLAALLLLLPGKAGKGAKRSKA